jgi:hypothetical protein
MSVMAVALYHDNGTIAIHRPVFPFRCCIMTVSEPHEVSFDVHQQVTHEMKFWTGACVYLCIEIFLTE